MANAISEPIKKNGVCNFICQMEFEICLSERNDSNKTLKQDVPLKEKKYPCHEFFIIFFQFTPIWKITSRPRFFQEEFY